MLRPCLNKGSRFELLKRESLISDVNYNKGSIKILFVYPNFYKVAISSLAWQFVYFQLNSIEFISCHRAVWDFSDPLVSLETGQHWSKYDMIAFHFSYELDYLNFIDILKLNNIPLLAKDRDDNFPIIFAGGIAISLFPDILLDFVDFVVAGEVEIFLQNLKSIFDIQGNISKFEFIEAISQKDNIYSKFSKEKKFKVNKKMDLIPFSPIITSMSYFKSNLLIEIGRGCPSFCFFCAASYLKKYPIFIRKNKIIELLENLDLRKVEKIGLLASSLGFYPDLKEILEYILSLHKTVSLSSLRPEIVDEELCYLIDKHNMFTITFAPETGSQEDRYKLNKKFDDEKLFHALELINRLTGVKKIRYYFMIGFGFSDEENKIIRFLEKSKKYFDKSISVSINPFIPKKKTPFENNPFADVKVLKKQYQKLRKELSKLNINYSFESIKKAKIQYELSNFKDSIYKYTE